VSINEGLIGLRKELETQHFTIKGTFKFPNIPNAQGIPTPLGANTTDTDLAFKLICEWHRNINRVLHKHPVSWRAFPEVLCKEGKDKRPLHYHFIAYTYKQKKFLKVAPNKWEDLIKRRYPKSPVPKLYVELIDRNMTDTDPYGYEAYILKQQHADWNAKNALSSNQLDKHESISLLRFLKLPEYVSSNMGKNHEVVPHSV